jgi:hypothetical protein
MSHYIHHIPGRLRVRSPLLKGNEREAACLQQALAGLEGVLKHEVKTITGSILVTYDTALTEADTILAFLEEHGYLNRAVALKQWHAIPSRRRYNPVLAELGSSVGKAFGKAIISFAAEKLAERSAVALISAIL